LSSVKNLIDALDNLVPVRNKHQVIEARAMHVIQSAINLIESLRVNYSKEQSDELTKRLVRSILSEDAGKFQRRLNQIKNQANNNGKN
jgi:hypothetical protein